MNSIMTKFAFVFLSLFVFDNVHAQAIPMHGSFVIVAVAKDGIMMASDSRGTFSYLDSAKKKIPLAYFDEVPKIYTFKHCAFAITGTFQLANIFISTVISEFRKGVKEDTLHVRNLLPSFFAFCQKKYAKAFYNHIIADTYFSAGFEDGNPVIISYDPFIRKMNEAPPNTLCETRKSVFGYLVSKNDSCASMAKKAEKAITLFAETNHVTAVIGGPVTALKITDNGFSYIQNQPADFRWLYYADFISDYRKHKVSLTFTSEENKKIFEKVLIEEFSKILHLKP